MPQTAFSPIMYVNDVANAMEYYKTAFDAIELRRWSNDDGSVHVAEMKIGNAMFFLHEETKTKKQLSPLTLDGTTIIVGLFAADPDSLFEKAVAAGAMVVHPIQDYEYGYRQGDLIDPFGHHWTIQKAI